MGAGRPRILFLAARYPAPARRGDQVRALHLAGALGKRADVRLLAFGDGTGPPIEGVDARTVPTGLGGRLAANLTAAPRLPAQVRLYLDTAMKRAVAAQLADWEPDVLHVTLARMAPYMPARAAFHRHLDLTDSLGLNMRTRAGSERGPARAAFAAESRLMVAYEARMAARADTCSVVSEADRGMPGLGGAAVIPNGVDLDAFPFVPRAAAGPVLAFFGNLGYFHNVEPAGFLAREVLPRVRREQPAARLLLVGARPAAAVRRLAELDGVELRADVPDMAVALADAAIAVLPSFSGSGIKNKVLEAFCGGLPVVGNRLGVQGVDGALDGHHLRIAEDADGIAAAALSLLADTAERERLALAARSLILERYTWERQAERLLELYGV